MTKEEKRAEQWKRIAKKQLQNEISHLSATQSKLTALGENYLGEWRSDKEIEDYYNLSRDYHKQTQALQKYYHLYGTDEQKAQVGSLNDVLIQQDRFLKTKDAAVSFYGGFKNATAYNNARAEWEAEQEFLESANEEEMQAELDKINAELATYNVFDYIGGIAWPLVDKKRELENDLEKVQNYRKGQAYDAMVQNEDFASGSAVNEAYLTDEHYRIVNGITGFEVDGVVPTVKDIAYTFGDTYYSNMTREEKQTWNYLYDQDKKLGSNQASDYERYLEPTLRARQTGDFVDFAKEHPFIGSVASILAVPVSAMEYIGNGAASLFDGKARESVASNFVTGTRSGVSDLIGNGVGSFVYNTGMSMIDSALASLIPYGAGAAVLGLSAAASTQNDILMRGGTDAQAFAGGIAAGIFEGFFERFSINQLRSMKPKEIVASWGAFAENMGKSVLTNASEETFTELANVISDEIIMGSLSNFSVMVEQYMAEGMTEEEARRKACGQLAGQVMESGASGALMGLSFGLLGGAVGVGKSIKAGKNTVTADASKHQMTATELLEGAEGLFVGEEYAEQQKLIKEIKANINKNDKAQQLRLGELEKAYFSEVQKKGGASFDTEDRDREKVLQKSALEHLDETVKTVEENAASVKVNPNHAAITEQRRPEIVSYSGMTSEDILVKPEGGETVRLSDSSVSDVDLAEIYEYAITTGSVSAANDFVQNWDGSDPKQYWMDWTLFQNAGYNGSTTEAFQKAQVRYKSSSLHASVQLKAFQSGSLQWAKEAKSRSEAASKLIAQYREKLGNGEGRTKATFDDSEVANKNLTRKQKELMRYLHAFSEALSVNIKIVATDGKRIINGSYNRTTNTIKIDINAGISQNATFEAIHSAVINTLSHESVHWMAANASEQYAVLRDLVLDFLYDDAHYDLDDAIEKQMEKRAETKTRAAAIEEIVARACEDILGNSQQMKEFLSELYKRDQTTFERFTEAVKEIFQNLKKLMEDLVEIFAHQSGTLEAAAIRRLGSEQLTALENAFMDGVKAAPEASSSRNKMIIRSDFTNNEQHSVREQVAEVEIAADPELDLRIRESSKSKYAVIREYLIEKLEGYEFVLSDGRIAVMDRSDAKKLASKADTKRTAQLSNLKKLVESASYDHSAHNIDHEKFTEFHYYSVNAKYHGKTYMLWINVGCAKNDKTNHIYSITNKKEEAPTKGVSGPVGNRIKNASSTNSISDSDQKINAFSEKNSGQENFIKKYLGDLYDDMEQFSINEEFENAFDAWDGKDTNTVFTVGRTSDALKSIGMRDQEIILRSGTVTQKLKKHPEMTRDLFKKIPYLLEKPVIVQFSDAIDPKTGKPKFDSRITVLGELYATMEADGVKEEKPVLVSMELLPTNRSGNAILDFSVITSAYAKEALQTYLSENSILYIDPDKKRTKSWLSLNRLQLPLGENKLGSVRSITYSGGKVKIENSKNKNSMQAALERAGIVDTYGNSIWQEEQNDAQHEAEEVFSLAEDDAADITIKDVEVLRSIGSKSINQFTSEEIRKAEKWARKFYKELGTKSPFFRSWFGDWRAQDKREVKIVSVPTIDISEAALAKGSYLIEDTGWNVYAGKTLNDDTRHHSGGNRINVKALNSIDAILSNAILLDTVVSKPNTNKKSATTAFLHKLYTLIKYGGQTYVAKTTVEEYYNETIKGISRRAYNLKAIKIELAGGQIGIESSSSRPDASSIFSISDVYRFVKQFDKDFSAGPEVDKNLLNEDGTPKVFYHGSPQDFSIFDWTKIGSLNDPGAYGRGFYFTPQKELADQYAGLGRNAKAYYLHMNNPLVIDSAKAFQEFNSFYFDEWAEHDFDDKILDRKTAELIQKGYDGIIVLQREKMNPKGERSLYNPNEYVVFDSKQIKSATDNIGTFDGEDQDTLHSYADDADTMKIRDGMSDNDRAAILQKKRLENIPFVNELPENLPDITSWEEVNRYFGAEKRKLIQKIASEFGVFKDYENEDVALSFEFSKNNFRESYNKQGSNFEQLSKMFSVFDSVVSKAVGIEVHRRKGYKSDVTLKNVYVLISAFQTGETIVPVKLEVKEFLDKKNSLYVAIALKDIKKTEVWKQGTTENGVAQNSRSVTISVSDLMRNVNPKHTNFTKYFPALFLTQEQAKELKISDGETEVFSYADDAVLSRDPSDILHGIISQLVDPAAKKNDPNASEKDVLKQYGKYHQSLKIYQEMQRTVERNQARIEQYDSDVVKLLRSNDYVRSINQKRKRLAEINEDLHGNHLSQTERNALEASKKRIEKSIQQLEKDLAELKLITENYGAATDVEALLSKQSTPLQDLGRIYNNRRLAENRISEAKAKMFELEAKDLARLIQDERNRLYAESMRVKRDTEVDMRETYAKRDLRAKIVKTTKELKKLFLEESKEKHIKQWLKETAAATLLAVDTDDTDLANRMEKLQKKIESTNAERYPFKVEVMQAEYDDLKERADRIAGEMRAIQIIYDSLTSEQAKKEDPLLAGVYDRNIAEAIRTCIQEIGDTPMRKMTVKQLETVYNLHRMVLTTIKNANRSFKVGQGENISELGISVMEEIKKIGKERNKIAEIKVLFEKYKWNNMTPIYAMRALGSKTFSMLFDNLLVGQNVYGADLQRAKNFVATVMNKYGYNQWDFKKKFKVTSTTGKEFELALGQVMQLYGYSGRPQADRHLMQGGFVLPEDVTVVERKKGIPVKYIVNKRNACTMNKKMLDDLVAQLSEEQKAYVDELIRYNSTVLSKDGNEVSIELYGIKLFNDPHYISIEAADDFTPEASKELGDKPAVRLKNSGMTKKTVRYANNPIVLREFDEAWARHVNQMAVYHGMTLPLEDFHRVFNYQMTEELQEFGKDSAVNERTSVKTIMKNAYGEAPAIYIANLIEQINGGVRVDHMEDDISKRISMYKRAVTMMSASVIIQQPTAVIRATAYIDPKYFFGTKINQTSKKHKERWEELKQYAPIAVIKEMGGFDTGIGYGTSAWILGKEYDGLKQKAGAVFSDKDYRNELISWMPAFADECGWLSIWEAVKREVAATTGLQGDTEEFFNTCGERFTEVINLTQVYDSVLSRSAFMRSKSAAMKMVTSFMAEPTLFLNMTMDAFLSTKRGDKKSACRVIGSCVTSMLFNAALVSLVYAARDDDEDETYGEKYLYSFSVELIEGLTPFNYMPIIRDMWSLMLGWDIERSDMVLFEDVVAGINGLFSEKKKPWRKYEDFVGSITNLFGIPAKNISRELRSIWNMIKMMTDLIESGEIESDGAGEALLNALDDTLPLLKKVRKINK